MSKEIKTTNITETQTLQSITEEQAGNVSGGQGFYVCPKCGEQFSTAIEHFRHCNDCCGEYFCGRCGNFVAGKEEHRLTCLG